MNTVIVRVKLFPKRGKEIKRVKGEKNRGRDGGRTDEKMREWRKKEKNVFISIKIYFNQYCPLASPDVLLVCLIH